ncbi:MAG: flagellar basal body P-ring protein FlgI [Phycisphaerae bacterium]|nr:flagellar basal body P-ring protein FlgI [Phycisphaerae bacterium]
MKRVALISSLIGLLFSTTAQAVKIADITRLGGQRTNVLTGLGLVFGLKGTGDGGDFLPAIKPLATMLGAFKDASAVKDLASAANVALVTLTATVPEGGAHEGDHIDVYVTSIGAASSLKGGRLFVTPMNGPIPGSDIYAVSEGAVDLEDPSTPTTAVVKSGCVMEVDWKTPSVNAAGRFSLILSDPAAGWINASLIAKVINDSADNPSDELAVASDAKTVIVTIPQVERVRPDGFIARIQQLPVPIRATEARVQVNARTGTIVMTHDVEISPVVISHKGLTISTMTPPPVPTPQNPIVKTKDVIALDTTNEGGAKLQDLVAALDAIKVPAEDRIEIIEELYKTGKLHAKLIVE